MTFYREHNQIHLAVIIIVRRGCSAVGVVIREGVGRVKLCLTVFEYGDGLQVTRAAELVSVWIDMAVGCPEIFIPIVIEICKAASPPEQGKS